MLLNCIPSSFLSRLHTASGSSAHPRRSLHNLLELPPPISVAPVSTRAPSTTSACTTARCWRNQRPVHSLPLGNQPAFAARQQRNKATSWKPCARLHWHIPTELPSASSPQPPPQTSYSTTTDHDSRQYQYTGAGEAGHRKAVWRSIGICQSSLELLGHPDTPCLAMGACMSSDVQDGDQKKRSQMIDRTLEEDSKKLRRECKILLLGMAMVRESK